MYIIPLTDPIPLSGFCVCNPLTITRLSMKFVLVFAALSPKSVPTSVLHLLQHLRFVWYILSVLHLLDLTYLLKRCAFFIMEQDGGHDSSWIKQLQD